MKNTNRFLFLTVRALVFLVISCFFTVFVMNNKQLFSGVSEYIILIIPLIISSRLLVYIGTSQKERAILTWGSFILAGVVFYISYEYSFETYYCMLIFLGLLVNGLAGVSKNMQEVMFGSAEDSQAAAKTEDGKSSQGGDP